MLHVTYCVFQLRVPRVTRLPHSLNSLISYCQATVYRTTAAAENTSTIGPAGPMHSTSYERQAAGLRACGGHSTCS